MSEQLIKTPGIFGENGNFLLERELGSGGMGGVYMGRDKMLDRPVAVKVMLREFGSNAAFVEKFKKEAQSAARLIHPNIAQVYSYGICDGMPYIAMELAPGGSLYSMMNTNPGKTDVARVIKICQQVAQALQCASDQGFVHGDVKPENILLDANGNAKLVDFGLAAMQEDTDEIWGTPYYISPEKVKKEQVDFRSDMYSLGGTLYHALTGVAPFEGSDSIAVVKKRLEGPPRKPSEVRPDLTPAIDGLVMKMLALNREDRYPSFEALLEAFKEVLTSGLTNSPAKPVAAPATAAPGGAPRRPSSMRSRRTMMLRRTSGAAALKKTGPAAAGAEGEGEDAEDTPRPLKKHRRPVIRTDDDEYEDEEEGGSVGGKVAGVIALVILLVAGVIGGLVWYKVADAKARAAEEQRQISTGIDTARKAIADTMLNAAKFADEFDAFAERAVQECQKPTDELKRIIPEDQGALLKPGPTKELLAAIAATNEAPAQADGQAATNAPAAAATNAPPAAAVKPAVTGPALPKFREPTEDEMDPASPEGEKYLKEKKAFQEEQLRKLKEKKAAGGAENGGGAGEEKKDDKPENAANGAEEKKSDQPFPAVVTMIELWERAYSCQASAVRIRHSVRKLLKKGEEANDIKGETREAMDKLAELSRVLVDMFDRIKASKDVENVKSGIGHIKNRGEKTVEQTVKRLRIQKLEEERKKKAEAEAAAEVARKKKMEEERKATVEKETASAKDKFAAIVDQGCFRQLDWKSALRMLNSLKAGMTTPEGQIAADLEIRKVNDMKMVHDIFIKHLKGYAFRGRLRNTVVDDVNEKELVIYRKASKEKQKIPWQKFYRDYPGNLNEIINAFIVNARLPSARHKITSPLEWANAMSGAALTMKLVCSEVNGALERAETLVKATVREFPDYEKTAKEIFPDVKFEDAAEENEEK